MRKWLPLLAICMGSFMLLIDVTIVNVALPAMSVDLSSSFTSLQWVIDAYALVLAALLLGFGSLSDAVGHRRLYVVGLVVFAAASVVCGAAADPAMLIAARAVQGIGGAAMFATTFGLLNSSYSGRDRGTAYGVWGAVSGAAAAVGPVLGGLLTQTISWRWIFFVNAPIGVATVALTLGVVPTVQRRRGKGFDVPGIAAFTVAATALTFAFTRSANAGWASPTVLACLCVALLALIVFLVTESRVRAPMIELSLFRSPVFTGSVVTALMLSFSGFGAFTYTTIWTQTLLGLSPIEAGLVCVPLPILSATLSPISGRFADRVPRSLAIGGGLALIGVGCLLNALLISTNGGWVALLPGLAVTGAGTGLCVPRMSSAATESAGDDRAGIAAGSINTARQLGQALGIALFGSLMATAAAVSLGSSGVLDRSRVASSLIGGGAQGILAAPPAGSRDDLREALDSAFASALGVAYLVAGVLAVTTALIVTWLLRSRQAGSSVIERRPVGVSAAE